MVTLKQDSKTDRRSQCDCADLVIEGGTVLTMVETQPPLHDVSIYVMDGRITDLRPNEKSYPTPAHRAQVIDGKNAVIMPGLINAHTHLAMTLFRGFADDLPLKQWLYEKIFPAEAQSLNPETVYWGSLLGCLELISSGTTCLADGYFFQDETVRAVHESGLRGLVAQGVLDFPAPGIQDPKENLKVASEFIEKWLSFSELITPGMFCHSPLTCSDRTLLSACDISRHFGVPLQIHLSETNDEVIEIVKKTGKRPVHYLDQLGLISPDLIAAHGVHLDQSEIECLGEKGAHLVHVPESNMKLCSGVSHVAAMLKTGLTVGLGTDGCASNNNLDLFCEMDTAAKLSKVMYSDPTILDAKTVLKMATSWGAKVLGLENEIGTIEKGKRADIIVVDLNCPHLCPVYDPHSTLVYSASGGDVKDVIVNGRPLMMDRKLISLDPVEIVDQVRRISRKISKQ